MRKLEELQAAHPVKDQAEYGRAYADADLAGQLAEIVYHLRTAAGLTQSELARRMGTTQSAIARVENCGSIPTLELLDRVGRAVGTKITLVVGDEAVHFGGAA
ncbi:MAG: XRE family transcriptional regulator [Actinomycetota bacterium]|nr:MAG: XRE family transcriptional regulator [Actinomycetota bacterium]